MSDSPSRIAAPLLMSVACLTIMVGCVIVPGLPATARALHIADADWLVTLPSLGVIIGSPPTGWLIRRIGAYRTLAAGLFLYGLLGAAGPLLSGTGIVYGDRLVLGCATAAVMAAGTTLIATFWQAPEARLRMIAAQGMAIELGGVLFLALGGWLAAWNWRYPFLIYLLAWLLLAVQLLCLRPPARTVSVEADLQAPRWPLDIFATATASMLIFFIAVLNLPPLLARISLGSTGSGLFLSFVSVVAVGAASQLPRLLPWLGEARTFAMAFASYALAFLIFLGAQSLSVAVAGAVLLGIGFGLSVPLVNHCVVDRSSPATLGPLLASLSLALFLGQFLASFAGFVPGGAATPFIAATVIAVVCAVSRFVAKRPRTS